MFKFPSWGSSGGGQAAAAAENKPPNKPNSLSVCFSPAEITFAEFKPEIASKPCLVNCHSLNRVMGQPIENSLEELFHGVNPASVLFTVVLDTSDYQLLQIEKPRLDEAELMGALQWLVKDLMDFSVEEAIYDRLDIPESKDESSNKQIYVVVARKQRVVEVLSPLIEMGFAVDSVDIKGLSLQNLMGFLKAGDKGGYTLMIQLEDNQALITVFKGEALCLSRPIISPFALEELVDEINQTKAYVVGQLAKHPSITLFILPVDSEQEALRNQLLEALTPELIALNWETIIDKPEELSFNVVNQCTTVVASALRGVEVKEETPDEV